MTTKSSNSIRKWCYCYLFISVSHTVYCNILPPSFWSFYKQAVSCFEVQFDSWKLQGHKRNDIANNSSENGSSLWRIRALELRPRQAHFLWAQRQGSFQEGSQPKHQPSWPLWPHSQDNTETHQQLPQFGKVHIEALVKKIFDIQVSLWMMRSLL